jgi:hypothetical protein
MTRRLIAGGGAALAALLLSAAGVFAGGWALIQPDEATAQPAAGETVEIGFRVLQHGETPASWVGASVVLEPVGGGEPITVPARSNDDDGHFVATVTFPDAGFWTWRVQLVDLINDSPPSVVGVLTADGQQPPFDPAAVMALIDRDADRLRAELADNFGRRIETLESQAMVQGTQLSAAIRDRDALAGRVAELEGTGPPLPAIGMVSLAVLGGALAGFAISVLGRRAEGAPSAPTAGVAAGTPPRTKQEPAAGV